MEKRLALFFVLGGLLVGGCSIAGTSRASSGSVSHYEYVINPGSVTVYDIDHNFTQVQTITLPFSTEQRGVVVNPPSHMMYISYGSFGPGSGTTDGSLLAYNLVTKKVVYNKSYDHGVDSMSITPDGKTIYMPQGENYETSPGYLYVINAKTGNQTGKIAVGAGPHDSLMSLDGKTVYVGVVNAPYLYEINTATNTVIRPVGPVGKGVGVRPFDISSGGAYAYMEVDNLIGFEVGDLSTGQILYRVAVPGVTDPPAYQAIGAASHGITLSPNGQHLYTMDAGHNDVHVFSTSPMPSAPPELVNTIPLTYIPCNYGCGGSSGWLQSSTDGSLIFVGNFGDVISTASNTVVGTIPAMADTRVTIEVDWQNGVPIATSGRQMLGQG